MWRLHWRKVVALTHGGFMDMGKHNIDTIVNCGNSVEHENTEMGGAIQG